jgi:hypothetical protein
MAHPTDSDNVSAASETTESFDPDRPADDASTGEVDAEGGPTDAEGGPTDAAAVEPPAGDSLAKMLDLALSSDPFHSAHLDTVAHDLMQQLAPQDAAEQMLVTQMIATFTRSMFLSRHANRQKKSQWFALYSGECDRAMNLYRKQMQTLAEYRRPRRTIFNAIRTANIAGQQVVLNDVATAHNPADPPAPETRPCPHSTNAESIPANGVTACHPSASPSLNRRFKKPSPGHRAPAPARPPASRPSAETT